MAVAAVAFQALAYTVTVKFDNPAAIESMSYTYNEVKTNLKPAETMSVSIDFDDTIAVSIVAKDGYAITKCNYVCPPHTDVDMFSGAYKESYDMYLSPGYDGSTWTYSTVNVSDLRTNTATVIVNGDASKVDLERSGTFTHPTLVSGTNTIKFMDSENTFYISPKSGALYSVKLNGAAVADSYGRWALYNVNNGDNIEIDADFPDKDCAITFSFANPGTEGFLKEVRINDEAVDWADGVTAKAGDTLAFSLDTEKYRFDSATINGTAAYIYGSYSTTVREDMAFYLNASLYGSCVATVNVDNPDYVAYRIGWDGEFQAVPGPQFTIEVAENAIYSSPVYFKSVGDSNIVSVKAGSSELSKDSYSGTYCTYLSDGMVIDITTEALIRDKKAVVYFHNPDDSYDYNVGMYGCYFSNQMSSSISLNKGHNVFDFGDIDNPFVFTLSGYYSNNSHIKLYRNGELTECDAPISDYSSIWTLELADNEVVKIYVADDEPEPLGLVFSISGLDELPEIVYDYVAPFDPANCVSPMADEYSSTVTYQDLVLPGTHVTIRPNSKALSVRIENALLQANEDGSYSFMVYDDMNINIAADNTTVIESVAVDENDGRIYNLQGIEMKADRLPAGIYIRDGRKIVVK